MPTTTATPEPGEDEEHRHDAEQENASPDEEETEQSGQRPPGDPFNDIAKSISRAYTPPPIMNKAFTEALRNSVLSESSALNDAAKSLAAAAHRTLPTVDFSHLLKSIRPSYDYSALAAAVAAQNNALAIDSEVLRRFTVRPDFTAIPPVVAGAYFSTREREEDQDAEGAEANEDSEATGHEDQASEVNWDTDEDGDIIVELVREDFDTGDLSDSEVVSTIQEGTTQLQGMSPDAQQTVSAVANLMHWVKKNGEVHTSQFAKMIMLEEQKIAAANERTVVAEKRANEAEAREELVRKREDSRGKTQTALTAGGLLVAFFSLIVAIMALG